MMPRGFVAALLFFLGIARLNAQPGPEFKIVGYFSEPSVYQRKYHVGDIPAAQLTHVNYAFAKISAQGECAIVDPYAAIDKFYPGDSWDKGFLRGNFHQFQVLKKKQPHLKTLISVGGWTLSGSFSDVALTDKSRQAAAASCLAFMLKYDFDGIDVDWEYPVSGGLEGNKTRPEDKQNYTLLLGELRRQLDGQGKKDKRAYLLTIAAPAGPGVIVNLELDKIHPLVDWLNLMAYDFHGAWSPLTNFNAPMPSVDQAVKAYLKAGVPPAKIVVGVPFFGRGWSGVKNVNNGLFQPHAKKPPPGTWEPGQFDYKDLAKNYVGKLKRYWHDEAQCPWLFDDKTGLMISYDDDQSLKVKAGFIRREKLGGAMIWELNGDDAQGTLVGALHGLLRKK